MVLFCIVITSASFAEDVPSREDTTKSVRKRQKDAERAIAFASWLSLSKEQAHQLLFILEDAAELHIQAYETETELIPQALSAYRDFCEEDKRNLGFSEMVEKRAVEIHRTEVAHRDEIMEAFVALELKALGLLSDQQLELANATGRADWVEGLRSHTAPAKAVAGRIAWRRHKRKQREKSKLEQTKEKLNEHNRLIHPRLKQAGKYLLHPASMNIYCDKAGFNPSDKMREATSIFHHGTKNYPIAKYLSDKKVLSDIRAEINNWNLINGLNLSTDQINAIIRLYNRNARDLTGSRGRAKQHAGQRDTILFDMERKVEKVLNTGQRQVLAEYKPCLIPPKNLKNPVRVGQANDSSAHMKWLTRARRVKKERVATLIEFLLEREQEKLGPLSKNELAKRWDLVAGTVQEARSLNDVDFELNKEDLAQRIVPRDVKAELKSTIAELAEKQGKPDYIARFILNERFVSQLRKRLQDSKVDNAREARRKAIRNRKR